MMTGMFSVFSLLIFQEVIANDSNVGLPTCQLHNDTICLPQSYDKYRHPRDQIDIKTRIDITKVTDVNDERYSVEFLMYMNVWWEDDRIVCRDVSESETDFLGNKYSVLLKNSWMDHIWLPDLYVYNMKDLKTSTLLQPLQSNTLPN